MARVLRDPPHFLALSAPLPFPLPLPLPPPSPDPAGGIGRGKREREREGVGGEQTAVRAGLLLCAWILRQKMRGCLRRLSHRETQAGMEATPALRRVGWSTRRERAPLLRVRQVIESRAAPIG